MKSFRGDLREKEENVALDEAKTYNELSKEDKAVINGINEIGDKLNKLEKLINKSSKSKESKLQKKYKTFKDAFLVFDITVADIIKDNDTFKKDWE